jgi:hypothetical protein
MEGDPTYGPVAGNLELLNGKPVFLARSVSQDPEGKDQLLFYRALDTYGKAWADPLLLTANEFDQYYLRPNSSPPVLLVGLTKPMALWMDVRWGIYDIATSTSGQSWPERISTFSENAVYPIKMLAANVVAGQPAWVEHTGGSVGKLYFARAANYEEDNWTDLKDPNLLVQSLTREYEASSLLNGSLPIVVQPFLETTDSPPMRRLHVFRSADPLGLGEWSEPYELLTDFRSATAALIDGVPTVVAGGAKGFGSPDALLYIRATDETGTTWSEPEVIGSYSGQVALREINGKPVVAFAMDPDNPDGPQIDFIQGSDATGTAWSEPDMVGCAIGADRYVSAIALAELTGGYPACMYTVGSTDPDVLPVVHYAWRHTL